MNTTTTGRATIEKNPTRQAMATPIQYLDKAMTRLRDLGLVPEKTGRSADRRAAEPRLRSRPGQGRRDRAHALPSERCSTKSCASRSRRCARRALREDHRRLQQHSRRREDAWSKQVEDGRIDTWERLGNVWQKATRGDISGRFDKIKKTYLEVVKDSKDQIEREQVILAGVPGFPRRAEGIGGARAAGAEGRRRRARSRAGAS